MNEETAGQVVFSLNSFSRYGFRAFPFETFNPRSVLPDVFELFNLKMDKHPDDLSCAERAESAPQNILTNIQAANIVLNYCSLVIRNESIFKISKDYAGRRDSSYYQNLYVQLKPLIYPVIYFDISTGISSGEKILDWIDSSNAEEIYEKLYNNRDSDLSHYRETIKEFFEPTRKVYEKEENVVLIGAN